MHLQVQVFAYIFFDFVVIVQVLPLALEFAVRQEPMVGRRHVVQSTVAVLLCAI